MSRHVDRETSTGALRRIHVVIKAAQKVEVANYLLSLSFDATSGWTDALICGDGVVRKREQDRDHGSQTKQLINAITASPQAWCNPLFLSYILLQNYAQRLEVSADILDRATLKLESKLGVTRVHENRKNMDRETWLQSIDPMQMTIELHTLLPHVGFMANCCRWLQNDARFLLGLEEELRADIAFPHQVAIFTELRAAILHLLSLVIGEENHFTTLRDRLTLQTNLLFNIVAQKDSMLNLRDSRINQMIAQSAKQDSISVTTFTFITALFLPGTFIATLFSMTMFDWQSADGSDGASSLSNSYVSDKFWLFWAIAVPLTIITMTGWLLWFKYANAKWTRELKAASSRTTSSSGSTDLFTLSPGSGWYDIPQRSTLFDPTDHR